ncbi:MAG: hypothetical protein JNL98_30380 [Bryobacterales bacterium]|nr:hypothetical protein [Bryobacterales bacterium]
MKTRVAILILGAVAIWLVAQPSAKPLASITPPGAVLYIEAKNFGALLTEWNASAEKRAWLASTNHEVFSRSRLFLRLGDVYDEYAKAVGLPPDMNLLNSVAGAESALAVYDINSLEFLYVTRLASARAMQSVVWQVREKFAQRSASGVTYYAKTDGASKRTAAFAIAGDLLLLATREDALTAALALNAGAQGAPVATEPWFVDALKEAGSAGEVRMVTNMERLVRAPAFRSYWVQRNVADMRQYRAAISDIRREGNEFKEERVLLRAEAAPAPDITALRELSRLVSPSATVYRAWAKPDAEAAAKWISARLLNPGTTIAARTEMAPNVSAGPGIAGDESDLETRLDSPASEANENVFREVPLRDLLLANRPLAMLSMHQLRTQSDQVFVNHDTVIALRAGSAWNATPVRDALVQSLSRVISTSAIGMQWRDQQGIAELDGLHPLAIQVQGNVLLISNRAEAIRSLASGSSAVQWPANVSYVAGYRVGPEVASVERMMRLIEFPGRDASGGEPPLFSANLPSLARSLRRLQAVTVAEQDQGRAVRQSVSYRMTP